MIKFISIFSHPAGASLEEVRDFWFNVHAPFVKANLPGLRKYVINLPLRVPGAPDPACDGVVELHFDDVAALQAALASPGWASAERKTSSSTVIDYQRFRGIWAEEHVIPLG
ncbi:EthD family reductase [Piscinibacter koreensis]|uniref:EthD family reductase n=1 Tax=Piscinibacter koreensis TaxID=2742824 RepID=A0A7Y6NMY6_9BURK|nr:EthD family reductase [Schlegelella koreensis]